MSAKGQGSVESKDMFPSPTIYNDQKPVAPTFPSIKVAEMLGLQEGQVGIVIVKRRATGGTDCVTAVIHSDKDEGKLKADLREVTLSFVKKRTKE